MSAFALDSTFERRGVGRGTILNMVGKVRKSVDYGGKKGLQ